MSAIPDSSGKTVCSPSLTRNSSVFALAFRFPAGRYHATPWGRNVNEADVAWPPEPWRILRALVACYWRKGDRERWSEDDLARLIDVLAEDLPVLRLPEGAIHAHTRHYMPIRKVGKTTLIFDAFLRLPRCAEVVAIWQNTTLDTRSLALARDLTSGMGYLGRAESWTDCQVLMETEVEPNCGPAEGGFRGQTTRVLVSRSPRAYATERKRLMRREEVKIRATWTKKQRLTAGVLQENVEKSFRATKSGLDTLPPRLLDALSLDTADLQNRGWSQPPTAHEVVYALSPAARPGVVSRSHSPRKARSQMSDRSPTVARYLLAGRPLPRVEDAVKIGEVMRMAAMSKFGWRTDERTGKSFPEAPWQISGRNEAGRPLRDPAHPHAFWLPEDADGDGWIDHLIVYIGGGMSRDVRRRLDLITRLWLSPGRTSRVSSKAPGRKVDEWRLALEGFGHPQDFEGSSRMLGHSRYWESLTPFLAAGHLKKAGYAGEAIRLLKRRGIDTEGVTVKEKRRQEIMVGGTRRRALNFHRFRSRGREEQPDASGAVIEIEFPYPFRGPLALGYASHFGLGMFGVVEGTEAG